MAPPQSDAVFPVYVLLLSVKVPSLSMAPPSVPSVALFPLNVLSVTVKVPEL